MQLELRSSPVRLVRFGSATLLAEGVLTIDADELRSAIGGHPGLEGVDFDAARPGEAVRIIHVLDAVEPRAKLGGVARTFPGHIGPPLAVGHGRTHRLAGMAVIETASRLWTEHGISVKDAMFDMTGPAAVYSPLSSTVNLVLLCRLRPGATSGQWEEGIRLAGLRAAEYLAAVTARQFAGVPATYVLRPAPGLPRVAYVCFLSVEGTVHHNYVYGRDLETLPVLLHPNEFMDGAVVSGNYHSPCFRTATYIHQNHPVIDELYRRHGQSVDFRGVILARTLNVSGFDKTLVPNRILATARTLGVDGVVVTHDAGGHAAVELMSTVQLCEQAGIRTVVITEEIGGPDGRSQSLVTSVPEANAIVSTGNRDEAVDFPAVERVIGGGTWEDVDPHEPPLAVPPDAAFTAPLRRVFAATSHAGSGRLGTELF